MIFDDGIGGGVSIFDDGGGGVSVGVGVGDVSVNVGVDVSVFDVVDKSGPEKIHKTTQKLKKNILSLL